MVYDIRERFVIQDQDGTVEVLLELLREGGRTISELAAELRARGRPVPAGEVDAAIRLLDSYRLLEDGRRLGQINGAGPERFFSNLAYFESFATLERSREDFQQALREAHVLVLGTGGLNSNTIPHLCGLGIGHLTLLDQDAVEARNFARQYLYRHCDIGARKVHMAAEWVRAYDPDIKVEALDAGVRGPDDVMDLVDRLAPDVVMSGIDSPNGVDDWVNAGTVSRGVPYVRGGMFVTQGKIYSVDPGVSACRACADAESRPDSEASAADEEAAAADEEAAAFALFSQGPRVNRGIGPVAGVLGALSAFEVLRYLTRIEPPAYAGRPVLIDFSGGCTTTQPFTWPRNPSCAVCGDDRAGWSVR